ncbi:MAG TPA: M20/M25/M40 family metallo-hydrolase [Beijerinckiaceae bacterium]|nr:M20/M25/M40 family metallo-hydrolase [Beijerinckiaceae bacterium]
MTGGARGRVQERIAAGFDRTIEDIRAAIRIPGISKSGEGLDQMAAWVAAYLRDLGAQVRLVPGKVAPIVEGELRGAEGAPTLLFYTLYDVQPADPAEWTSPPFEARIVDGPAGPRLVGRGAFNSKGPLVGFLAALKAFREAGVPLPVNIVFLIEGEEEIGSPSLEPYIRANLDRLRACDAAYLPYLGTNSKGETPIRLGFKGLCFLHFSVEGGDWGGPARHDVHAMHCAWLGSPGWELLSALATLQSRDGRLSIDGLPSPPGPDAADRALIVDAARVVRPETFLAELGATRFKEDALFEDLLARFLFEPTLNLDGIWVGTTPPGAEPATHLAHRASAVMDLRFVPGMAVEETIASIRAHLDRRGFAHVRMEARNAYPACKCPTDSPIVEALVRACRRHCDRVMVFPLHAGAAPLYLFSDVIGIPFAFGGLGHGGRPHAPDEYLDVETMRAHLAAVADFLFEAGERLC